MTKLVNSYNGTNVYDMTNLIGTNLMLKEGLIYRSSKEVNDDSLVESLHKLNIKNVISFSEDQKEIDGINNILLKPLNYTDDVTEVNNISCSTFEDDKNCHDLRSTAYNQSLLRNNKSIKQLVTLLKEKKLPILLVDSSGFNSSGLAILLIYLLLGSSRKQAMEVYLTQKTEQKGLFKSIISIFTNNSSLALNKFAEVTLDTIYQQYESVDEFFEIEYGLSQEDISEIRNFMLVDVDDVLVRYQLIVSGRVQDVGFRAFCSQLAAEYHITGSVQNLDNGNVEIFAQSSQENIENFIEEIYKGNKFVRVDDIEKKKIQINIKENIFIYK